MNALSRNSILSALLFWRAALVEAWRQDSAVRVLQTSMMIARLEKLITP